MNNKHAFMVKWYTARSNTGALSLTSVTMMRTLAVAVLRGRVRVRVMMRVMKRVIVLTS